MYIVLVAFWKLLARTAQVVHVAGVFEFVAYLQVAGMSLDPLLLWIYSVRRQVDVNHLDANIDIEKYKMRKPVQSCRPHPRYEQSFRACIGMSVPSIRR
jgi:hypothetical protein